MMKRILLAALLMGSMAVYAQEAKEYKMAGPYEIVARDGEHRRTKGAASVICIPRGSWHKRVKPSRR